MEKTRYTKIATVPYESASPLTAGLEDDAQIKLLKAPPAAMLNMLEMKKADIVLLPSIDYQLIKQVR